jgi:3-methyladenine DNA glycosylase AlkD
MPDPPKVVVNRVLAELERTGTPARAAGAARYFRAYERLRFFGVETASVRQLAARVVTEQRSWTISDATAFADRLVSRQELEAKLVGMVVLGRYRASFPPGLLNTAKRWLAEHCTDWASTDALCGEVIGPLLERHPRLVPRLRAWRTSRHLYVRRASAVALLGLVRRRRVLTEAYDAARALGGDSHHLLQKAAGWVLREAGKADMPRLERFLLRFGAGLSRTTVSYAIERFPPRRRSALLAATRVARRSAVL